MPEAIDYNERIGQYVSNVLSGKLLSCEKVKAACQRHLDDLANDDFDFEWHPALAQAHCEFFHFYEHTTGAYDGQRFELYPFQAFIVGSIFGWRHKKTGYRRFSTAFVSLGRGNGKSPLAAGIALQMFVADYPIENRAEVYSVATKVDQARIIFEECKRFVIRSPLLKKRIKTFNHTLTIPENFSTLRPIASEGKTADGQIPHCVTLDELHAFTHVHRDLIDRLETGFAKRNQPLLLITTTAGDENSEIWIEYYNVVENVLDKQSAIIGDHIFAYVAELDEDDDELDEACWPKSNPLMEYGVVKVDGIRKKADEAKVDPGKRLQLRRFYGNRLTISRTKTFQPDLWDIGNLPLPDFKGMECFAGVDLGFKNDLSAIGYCFPLEEYVNGKRCYALDVDVWCPQHQRVRNLNQGQWPSWLKNGYLTATDSEWTDTGSMYDRLIERMETTGIVEFAYDPNNATEFATNILNRVGIANTHSFNQRPNKYNEPLTEFIIALSEGRILHGGNPILRWAAMNVVERSDANGNRMPDKNRCREKIDPFIAVLMAFALAIFNEPVGRVDYYEHNEVEIF